MSARRLIKTLRHDLVRFGLSPDSEGYVKLSDLVVLPGLSGLTGEMVKEMAASDDKGRFGVKEREGELWIRANQGHSKAVGDLITDGLTLITTPIAGVFHGTYLEHRESIMRSGLLPMSRKHIHIARSMEAKSGKRSNCTLLVYVDMAAAMADGVTFYESENGVILTEGPLPPKYLTLI